MATATTPPEGESSAVERRLATILAADVAGYSRMMGEDEEATVQTLRGHRAVFDGLLGQHRGRVFNTAGDMILAEFPSAVEAVRCATEIQAALHTRNAKLPEARKMLFRMGINLGDVVVQDGDLLGDGVNVAARIQTVAEPGGICISGSVYDQIQNKLSLQMKQLSDQTFKNIGKPVRTFTITDGESGPLPTRQPATYGKLARVAGVGTACFALLAAGSYWLYRDHETRQAEQGRLTTQLAAEKQAAEDARHLAEQETRRAAAAESQAAQQRENAKREAGLNAQAQLPAGAQRREDADRKTTEGEKRRLAFEKPLDRAPVKAQPSSADGAEPATAHSTNAIAPAATKSGGTTAAGAGFGAGNRVEGSYDGSVCNFPDDPAKRVCWKVPLKVANGLATGTWSRRNIGKPAQLHATISHEGGVKVTLDGWNVKDGSSLTGAMDGRLIGEHIDVVGRWANGVRIDGHWTHAP
jgi:class 3 adenylate cyclase